MTPTREMVVAAVVAGFPDREPALIMELLDEFGVESYERERERVQLAILHLSEGDEDKLLEYLIVAKRDYRDVLYWAEYPKEAALDTPEKKRMVDDLLTRFGSTPPD